MKLINIKPHDFVIRSINIWDKRWFLLTSGDFNKKEFNTMTIAWGSFGFMWNKPFAQVVVRPTRFTYEFMERYDTFTLTAFPKQYKKALQLLGTKSGKDSDKILESGLTPIASGIIESPTFKEADLSIECRKIYWDDFKPENFLDSQIHEVYPLKDYHRIYFGEILNIKGTEGFSK